MEEGAVISIISEAIKQHNGGAAEDFDCSLFPYLASVVLDDEGLKQGKKGWEQGIKEKLGPFLVGYGAAKDDEGAEKICENITGVLKPLVSSTFSKGEAKAGRSGGRRISMRITMPKYLNCNRTVL